MIVATFTTNTPCFSRFELEIDGQRVPIEGNAYRWSLKSGANTLRIRSLNVLGRPGSLSEFVLDYDPSSIDY